MTSVYAMLTDKQVISGIIKWCWSRLKGGVVGWDAYELFKIGEQGKLDSYRLRAQGARG